jgi:predicted butyrate kinase (DUF1464 family)
MPIHALEESQVTKEKNLEEQVKFQSKDDRFFFFIRGIIHIDWVPEGRTINQIYYKEVLTILHERMRRKRPEMC